MYPAVKLFILLLIIASCFIFTTSSVHAQVFGTPITNDNYKAQQNGQFSVKNIEFAAGCEGIGTGGTIFPNEDCLFVTSNGALRMAAITPDGGAVGSLNNVMVAMYSTPPATVSEYVAYVGSNIGLIPKAYAQVPGSGSGVIQPVFKLWTVIRDVSYLGFIVVFIVIGFMIMFRQRLNPQTVITVQSALPGLVIGLILVTFSYFIAALLIDVSFFTVQLIGSIFGQAGQNGLGNPQQLLDISQRSDIFTVFRYFTLNGNTVSTIASPIISAFNATSTTSGVSIQGIVMDIFAALNPNAAGGIGSVVSGLVFTILIIAVIIQMIRLVWAMLQAYISIFVNTILGPIFILYSTLPGRHGALTFWWKNILGNALIFPAVFAAILFAGYIVGPATPNGGTNINDFGSSLPLLAFPQGTLRAILAFGIVLGTPSIPKMVKSAIGVKDLGEIATAAIGGFAAGSSLVGAQSRGAYSSGLQASGLASLRELRDRQYQSAARKNAATIVAPGGKMDRVLSWLPKP